MTYLAEIRTHKRYLTAAALGQAAGYSLINYVGNIFTPNLISEFGWTRSQIALIGTVIFINILAQPIAGRLADAFGVWRMAAVGVVTMPIVFLGLSAMTGPIWQFVALTVIMVVVVGGTTTATIYSRLIAQKFDRARGISLAIAASAPALAGAAAVPFLSVLVEKSGWRAGYLALAVGTAIIGAAALMLIPKGIDSNVRLPLASSKQQNVYHKIVNNRAFLIIVSALVLCNLSFSLQTSQLKVVLLDKGIDLETIALALAIFPIGVIAGRLLSGIALDRFAAYAVVSISLGLPGLGLLMLATGSMSPALIAAAVLMLGLGLGAEGDVLAYLAMRYFEPNIYSTVLGMVFGALAFSIAAGALLLSGMLRLGYSYTAFMALSGIAAILGGLTFLMLKRLPMVG